MKKSLRLIFLTFIATVSLNSFAVEVEEKKQEQTSNVSDIDIEEIEKQKNKKMQRVDGVQIEESSAELPKLEGEN